MRGLRGPGPPGSQGADGPHPVNAVLETQIVGGPVIAIAYALSAGLVVYLLARRPSRRWLLTLAIAALTGAAAAVATWFVAIRVMHTVEIPLTHLVYLWLAATLVAVCIAIANLWRSRWWRKLVAAIAVLVFAATGTLAVNAVFGIDRTLAQFLGVTIRRPIALTPPTSGAVPAQARGPLWKTWAPPSGMPALGKTGTAAIPGTVSGFTARPAGIYLPPAAMVKDPPPLPLVVMMMGQPGNPTPHYVADALNRLAARHHGLAPIVIVADQLGNPNTDTLCLNTPEYGNVETYITQDVVNWALAHLNVTHDHRYWTIAGYSNGGECAVSFAVKHPQLWSNVIDISGEEYPGFDNPRWTLQHIFHGDQAAYDAQDPVTMLAHTRLPGTFGVFTIGSNDATFKPGVLRTVAAAEAAGMTVDYHEIPHGGHVLPALSDGLAYAFAQLYPRLGLAPPAAASAA